MASNPESHENDAAALTQAALGAGGSVTEMLRTVAKLLRARGAVLWELAPGHDLKAVPPTGKLFTLATVFDTKDSFAVDSLGLDSATGEAFLAGEVRAFEDLQEQGGSGRNHPFIVRHDLRRMCTAPISFLGGTERGALNVYRSGAEPEFDDGDRLRLRSMAALVPALFRAARDREGLHLVNAISEIARGTYESESKSKEPVSKESQKTRLLAMCRRIAEAFNCHEATIILEDWLEPQRQFECQATTVDWDWDKRSYSPEDTDRLTGWALKHRAAIVIRDLRHLGRDDERTALLRDHPFLPVHVRRNDVELAKRVLLTDNEAELPPLTYMIAPIMAGPRLLGAVRCHLAKTSSFYFSPRDLELLKTVAAQIGHFWHVWLSSTVKDLERQSWHDVVVELGHLNDGAIDLLRGKELVSAREAILEKALRLSGRVVKGADINTVRLLDETDRCLRFTTAARRNGPAKDDFLVGDQVPLPDIRFEIDGPVASAGIQCYRSDAPYVMRNTEKDPFYREVFPGVTSMLIVPISVGDRRFGVLDLRWLGGNPIPDHAEEAARLIGRQVGLYLELDTHVRSLRRARTQASDQEARVRQNLEDFAHQLKGPLIQAERRARQSLDLSGTESDTTRQRETLGLIRKAYRVSAAMRLLAELSKGAKIACRPTSLDPDRFIRLLSATALDTEARFDPRRLFRFQIEPGGIRSGLRRLVEADFDLLEQVIGNLFDNAAKYSYPNTVARVYGGLSKGGQFYLAVANRGLVMSERDQRRCLERGYRSDSAKEVTGEGSGIGLYIVDQIIRSHQGRVEVNRRTPDEMTEVRFYLPVREGPRS